MLGLDNPIHILFLLVIVLLVFGAKRLPEMGKSLGDGLRGFKESVSGESHESSTPELTALQSTPSPVPATDADTWSGIAAVHETETERVPARPAAQPRPLDQATADADARRNRVRGAPPRVR